MFRRKLTYKYLAKRCTVYWFDDTGALVRYIGITPLDESEFAIRQSRGRFSLLRRCPSERGEYVGEWSEWLGGIRYRHQFKTILKTLGIKIRKWTSRY